MLTNTHGHAASRGPTTTSPPAVPDTMVDGLTQAFASIANAIKAFTTSFSLSTPQVASQRRGLLCLAVRRQRLDRRLSRRSTMTFVHRRRADFIDR